MEDLTMKPLSMSLTVAILAMTPLALSAHGATSEGGRAKELERVHFSPYNGKQQDWPTSQKATLDVQRTKYGISIYRDLPGQPYEILGTIRAGGSSVLKHAVQGAQAAGADAILCADDKAFVDLGVKPQVTLRGNTSGKIDLIQGILIRWKK